MNDTYYDDEFHTLTKRDVWLRQRGNIFELKYPMSSDVSDNTGLAGLDFYHESTDWNEIYAKISNYTTRDLSAGFSPNFTTAEAQLWLSSHDLSIFSRFHTKRSRQSISLLVPSGTAKINIDVDEVLFLDPSQSGAGDNSLNDTPYILGEIELLACSGTTDPSMVMGEVFQVLELSDGTVRGKVLEYLHRFRPDHYTQLEASGVIGSKGIAS